MELITLMILGYVQGFAGMEKCKSVKAEDDSSSNSLTLTVEFDVYPFALRENISYSDVFDRGLFHRR